MAINGALGDLTAAERAKRAAALTLAETAARALRSGATPAGERRDVAGGDAGAGAPDRPEIADFPAMPEAADDSDARRLPAAIWAGAPVDRWVAGNDGIRRWRPIVDHIRVVDLPDGARVIEQSGLRPVTLAGPEAAHLAWLLMPSEWRVQLAAAGVR